MAIPPDDVWDEAWDAPLTQTRWNAVKWMYEDRSQLPPTDDDTE